MSQIARFRFALTQLLREWRAGELNVLLLALLIAIGSHTAIGYFSDRVNAAMAFKARDLIGGDLMLTSPRAVPPEWLAEAQRRGLRQAATQEFSSVVSTDNGMLLVSAKSVSDAYPLKGMLRTSDEMYGAEQQRDHGPAAGEAWAEPRVLQSLGIEPGDAIEIGLIELPVTRVLNFEPDRGGNFYSFTPRVMIHQDNLEATGIVQPGSRVKYRHLFAGDDAAIGDFSDWLDERLTPSQTLHGLDGERPAVGNALNKAGQYMGLASLLALLLAAVAIAICGNHYSQRHYDTSALLRCMGCQQRDILWIYLWQLFLLALFGGLAGNALGWGTQALLVWLVADLLPPYLPAASMAPFWSGLVLSQVVLIGFTLPSVLRLKQVPPQRVLRRDLTPMPLSGWLVTLFSTVLLIGLMWFYTGNLVLTVAVLAGIALTLLLTAVLVRLLFTVVARLLPGLPLVLRAGVRNFLRRRSEATGQTLAFALTLMAMLIILFLRTELIGQWQNSIPEDAPNHFAINVLDEDVDTFKTFLRNNGIESQPLYPVVRGRLTHVNDEPVREHVSKEERNSGSLNRELNLTWSTELPQDNRLLRGDWWPEVSSLADPAVSIEEQLAERLNIGLGDRLTFFTGEQQVSAVVHSIRSVQWDSFHPNFYMIFEPGGLDGLPVTHMTSFYLDREQKPVLSQLNRNFPSVSVLEMDAILEQVKGIMTQATLGIEAILLFVLAAGATITLATVCASLDQRLHESSLMRTLGADRGLILNSNRSEFASLGLLSGLIAVLGAELVNAQLYQRIFQIDYVPVWWAWLLVPLLAAVLTGVLGAWSCRRTVRHSPLSVLREL